MLRLGPKGKLDVHSEAEGAFKCETGCNFVWLYKKGVCLLCNRQVWTYNMCLYCALQCERGRAWRWIGEAQRAPFFVATVYTPGFLQSRLKYVCIKIHCGRGTHGHMGVQGRTRARECGTRILHIWYRKWYTWYVLSVPADHPKIFNSGKSVWSLIVTISKSVPDV